MNSLVTLARAYDFAAVKHIGQRRKGDAGEPYINHLTEVAALVAEATGGADPDLIVAAILHDTVEDTGATPGELAASFGPRVASLVAEVTDDKSLPKAERKRLQIEHAAHASTGAKTIKIADKTSNLRALAASPPTGWARERRDDYLNWASEVVARCRCVNPWLEAQFDAAAAALRGGG
ncbi:MAG: bifunctional (p)ppGpp synthetase/guanosine-3',5'-bis(diphosphate) 3'-pyrophosphohydrolase [Caulobacteraceae bacterium]|nr:bifunctional (p)ppGpp synthetase/guanosine-3',5'-bis(diphosphate) 3'-pyrophosphohydrolase [Caulobacteraceae bacterium]